MKQKHSEAEIIVIMRQALDELKHQWEDAQGSWKLAEFIAAANEPDHWIHKIVRAEELSQPYIDKKKS